MASGLFRSGQSYPSCIPRNNLKSVTSRFKTEGYTEEGDREPYAREDNSEKNY